MKGLWPISNSFLHRMKLYRSSFILLTWIPSSSVQLAWEGAFSPIFWHLCKIWVGCSCVNWVLAVLLCSVGVFPATQLQTSCGCYYDLIVIFFCSRLFWLVRVFVFPCEYQILMGIELNLYFKYHRYFPSVWQYMSMGGHCRVQCHLLCPSLML